MTLRRDDKRVGRSPLLPAEWKVFGAAVVIAVVGAAYSASVAHRTPGGADHECTENLRAIVTALRYYSMDHGGSLPPADPPGAWVAGVAPHMGLNGETVLRVLRCPNDPDRGKLTSYRRPQRRAQW